MNHTICILFLLILCSCSESGLETRTLEQIKEVASKNKGVNKILFQNSTNYLVLFSNGSTMGDQSLKESNYKTSDILGSELRICEDLCSNNEELLNINISRYCSDSKISSTSSVCLEYQNKIECECRNTVKKEIIRIISLSEEEKQRLIESLKDVVWIAPQ